MRIPDTMKGLLVLGGLVALFAWSGWAGFAGVALVALWIAWIVGGDALQQRALKRRWRAQLEQALAEHGLGVDAVFHGHRGVAAIGISVVGRKLVCASPAWRDLYDLDAVLEAWARKLPQGDFSIGFSVPGRVSGRPYPHDLIVTRAHAVRWAETLGPCLGEKLKLEGLG